MNGWASVITAILEVVINNYHINDNNIAMSRTPP